MLFFLIGPKGGLKKIAKINFQDKDAYLIDDYKTLYLWFGKSVPKEKRELLLKKIDDLNNKREKTANIQVQEQHKEYGSFLSMLDVLKKGLKSETEIERRPELEIDYEDALELMETGLEPDFEAEITIASHELMGEKKSYDDLCKMLAKTQLSLLHKTKINEKDIKKRADEIYKSSSTYEELCWLIAELDIMQKKQTFDKK